MGPHKSKVIRRVATGRIGPVNYQDRNFELTDNFRSKKLCVLLRAISHKRPLPREGRPLHVYVSRLEWNLGLLIEKRIESS